MSGDALDHWDELYRRTGSGEANDEDMLPLLEAARFFGRVAGATVLDVGCGSGKASIFFARRGAQVIAFDTSDVAVRNLQALVEREGLNVRVETANALEADRFGPVEFVFGSFILHHVEPFPAFAETLSRTLAPYGRGFFWENNSPQLLIWCRNHLVGRYGIPKFGDADEQPLSSAEIDELRRFFRVDVKYPELYLARLVSTYLLGGRAASVCASFDRIGFRLRPLRKYSYRQYVYLSPPDITSTSAA
jgi:SAM-dependent methyltransferase